MSKVGEKLLNEEIINSFVNCNAVESVKYTEPSGPWFCPQIGLLTALEQFSHLLNKGMLSPLLLCKALSREKKNYVKCRHYQLHTFTVI